MPTWHRLVEPVSEGVTAAMTKAMDEQFERLKSEGLSGLDRRGRGAARGVPADLSGLDLGNLIGQIQPAVRQMAGSMFSAQLGHGVGALAADLLSATEVGLPLLDGEDVALLPANVAAFTEGLGIDVGEVRLYLAVREAARARLFAQVPWLGPQLEAAVRDYARNITIDTDAIEEQVRDMDLQNPAGIQEALRDKLFSPTPTAEQRAALDRLETSLALVEGWVDLVTEQATTGHLPHADALGEALRRRRVSGPAQKTFSGLVGLELRPRRLKDAKNLWAALENAGGADFRDAPWEHPDIAPTGADLDDPLGYVEKRRDAASSDDVDSALDALLRDDGGDDGTAAPPMRGPDPPERADPSPRRPPRCCSRTRPASCTHTSPPTGSRRRCAWSTSRSSPTTRTVSGRRGLRSTSRPAASSSTKAWPGAARRSTGARGCGSSSAATWSRRTVPCVRRLRVRRPRSRASRRCE